MKLLLAGALAGLALWFPTPTEASRYEKLLFLESNYWHCRIPTPDAFGHPRHQWPLLRVCGARRPAR